MVSTIRFDRANRDPVFDDLARVVDPQRVHITLHGDVRELATEVELTIADGRLIDARSGAVTEERAMLRLALAQSGELALYTADKPAPPLEQYPRLLGQFAEAEATALSLEALLAPCGGLASVLAADLNALMTQLASLPDAASSVLRLADGARTVAGILRDSPHDDMLTARILQRLVNASLLTLATPDMVADSMVRVDDPRGAPSPAAFEPAYDGSSLPTEDELEGAGVEADVHRWLEHETAPDSFLSEESFSAAFAQSQRKPLPPPPLSDRPAPPPPKMVAETAPVIEPARIEPPRTEKAPIANAPIANAPLEKPKRGEANEGEDDAAVLQQAGLESRSSNRAILIAGIVALAFVILLMSRRAGDKEPEPPKRPAVKTSTVAPVLSITATKTATLAATATPTPPLDRVTLTLRNAPPIAGPDAPEEVRRAESLLNEGKYAEAGKLLEQLRGKRPTDPAVWVLSGQHAVDSGGKLSVASERAEQALSINPKFYRGWVLKGSVLQFLGKRKQAADAYNRALKLEPDHPMSSELRTIVEGLGS